MLKTTIKVTFNMEDHTAKTMYNYHRMTVLTYIGYLLCLLYIF